MLKDQVVALQLGLKHLFYTCCVYTFINQHAYHSLQCLCSAKLEDFTAILKDLEDLFVVFTAILKDLEDLFVVFAETCCFMYY